MENVMARSLADNRFALNRALKLEDGGVLQRLGFPDVGPHRRFVVALAIDAVGSGIWMPLSMLYFLHQTSLEPGPARAGDDDRQLAGDPARRR